MIKLLKPCKKYTFEDGGLTKKINEIISFLNTRILETNNDVEKALSDIFDEPDCVCLDEDDLMVVNYLIARIIEGKADNEFCKSVAKQLQEKLND